MNNMNTLDESSREEEILNYYIQEKELGSGGMGKVFLVKNKINNELYAVKYRKYSLPENAEDKRGFYLELLNWLDLPETPHIAKCYFFRTLKEEVAIFAEYVNGGSVSDWINERRFSSTDELIDVAIQSAWGLDAIHQQGFVHQDIKPNNILLSQNRIAKIADFGLARARTKIHKIETDEVQSSYASFAGRATQKFRSLEQAEGKPLTIKTDMWSWGLTVLAMFAQESYWHDGIFAQEILENYLNQIPGDRGYKLPRGLDDLLRKCFAHNPHHRYGSMAEIADDLIQIYLTKTSTCYPRSKPVITISSFDEFERQSEKFGWRPPQYWLKLALEADNRDLMEADNLLYPKFSSRKAQTIADLASYEEAKLILDKLVNEEENGSNLQISQAMLYWQKAMLHGVVGDFPGGILLIEEAQKILVSLGEKENAPERYIGLVMDLIGVFQTRAYLLDEIGDLNSALDFLDRGILLFDSVLVQRLIGFPQVSPELHEYYDSLLRQCLIEFYPVLSELHEYKAILLREIEGDVTQKQLDLLDHVILLRKQFLNAGIYVNNTDFDSNETTYSRNPRELLSSALLNKAVRLQEISRHEEAIELYDQSLEIRQLLPSPEKEVKLVNLYLNKANSVLEVYGADEALKLYNTAIEIAEAEILQHDRYELELQLAFLYQGKAKALRIDNQLSQYHLWVEKSIELYEKLVHEEGQQNLLSRLIDVYLDYASSLANFKQWDISLKLFDRGIKFAENLLIYENKIDIYINLARLKNNKASIFINLGQLPEALSLIESIEQSFDDYNVKNHKKLFLTLAETYNSKAIAKERLGNLNEALQLCDRAIKLIENTNNSDKDRLASLSRFYKTKANIHYSEGNFQEAIQIYDTIIDFYNHSDKPLTIDNQSELSTIHNEKGAALSKIGKMEESIQEFTKASDILQPLVEQLKRFDFEDKLATYWINKGTALLELNQIEEAHQSFDEAIKLFQQLVDEKNRNDLANNLASVYVNKGEIYRRTNEPNKAKTLYEKAIAIREPLVRQQCTPEIVAQLANVYLNQAAVLQSTGEAENGMDFCRRAHDLLSSLVEENKLLQFRGELGIAKANLAIFTANKDLREAAPLFKDAVTILDEEFSRTGVEKYEDFLIKIITFSWLA